MEEENEFLLRVTELLPELDRDDDLKWISTYLRKMEAASGYLELVEVEVC